MSIFDLIIGISLSWEKALLIGSQTTAISFEFGLIIFIALARNLRISSKGFEENQIKRFKILKKVKHGPSLPPAYWGLFSIKISSGAAFGTRPAYWRRNLLRAFKWSKIKYIQISIFEQLFNISSVVSIGIFAQNWMIFDQNLLDCFRLQWKPRVYFFDQKIEAQLFEKQLYM